MQAAAPRPRKNGRFRVAISDRPPCPPWDPLLPEIGTGAWMMSQINLVSHQVHGPCQELNITVPTVIAGQVKPIRTTVEEQP